MEKTTLKPTFLFNIYFFFTSHDKEELKLNSLHLRCLRSVINHCTENTFYKLIHKFLAVYK